MGRYLVIENEPKLKDLITEAVKSIDNNCEILSFETLQAFQTNLSQIKDEEKEAYLKFSFYLLNLSDHATKDWKKMIDDLKALGTNKEALICVTTYDNKGAPLNFLKQLDVFNVIYKPFDPLILKETINLALQKGKLANTIEMKSQKSSAFIGVLKEVELQSISELGFLTISEAPIPQMSLTKYFSPIFSTGRKQSVWAQCLVSAPHPGKPGHFINKFQFFCVKKDFLTQIRKYVNSLKPQETSSALWNLETQSKTAKIKIGLIGLHNPNTDGVHKDLQDRFTNAEVEFLNYESIENWPKSLDHQVVLNYSDLQFDQIKSFFKEGTSFFWLPQVEPKEDLFKDLVKNYHDIFSAPLDRSFFYKKLKAHIVDLNFKEPAYLLNVTCREIIKAANTIKVSEVNEVFINFHYSRELDVQTFREFIFVKGEDDQAIEIPAFCQFKEKVQNTQPGDKNIYFHQFVFFAMTDHFQKEIRLWLLQDYIKQNKKEE